MLIILWKFFKKNWEAREEAGLEANDVKDDKGSIFDIFLRGKHVYHTLTLTSLHP